MAFIKNKPTNIVPFWLYDISPFIEREHPVYLPDTAEYNAYWGETILDKCISGKWGLDSDGKGLGGYRWMPGNLYYYMNFTKILQERDGEPETTDYPLLRDIDWLIMYALNICDGFSGFEDDDVYTSFAVVKKLEDGTKLSGLDKKQLVSYAKYINNKQGKLKKYIDPREYLYKTHDTPKGYPLYHNPCTNFMLMSTRGCGKSYTINGDISHSFVFNGARSLYSYYNGNPSTTIVVGSGDSSKSAELLDKFVKNYDELKNSVGEYKSDSHNVYGAYWTPTEGSLELNKKLKKRVKAEGGQGYVGNDTKLVHVSFQSNISAGVSYRARRIVCEEAGLIPKVQRVHGENEGSQMRETKIGFSIYIGTGGSVEKTRDIKEMFNSPAAFKLLPYRDDFNNTGKDIGLFIPAYYRKSAYKDDNGNTDIQLAFEDEMAEREAIQASNSKAYQNYIISFPIYPQEMFMQSTGGTFPTQMLEDRLNEIDTYDVQKNISIGKLTYINEANTECKWEESLTNKVRPYLALIDLEDKTRPNREGGIVIYEHPVSYKPDRFSPNPLYIAVYDPVEAEDNAGTSMCCVLVLKLWDVDRPDRLQFNIAAEWIGRYDRLEKNHETAFKLATYYGCKLFPEINKPDIKRYARMTNRYHWLEERPTLALDGAVKTRTEYDVGFKVLPGMKPDLEVYTNELLMTVIDTDESISGDALIVDNTYMAQKLTSKIGIEQLLSYNRDDNLDWVSTLFGAAVWVRQRKLKPIKYESIAQSINDSNSLKAFLSKKKHSNNTILNPAFNY